MNRDQQLDVKETVRVISPDLPFQESNPRYLSGPCKLYTFFLIFIIPSNYNSLSLFVTLLTNSFIHHIQDIYNTYFKIGFVKFKEFQVVFTFLLFVGNTEAHLVYITLLYNLGSTLPEVNTLHGCGLGRY